MNRTRSERTGAGMILGAGILWGTIGLFVKQLNACGASPELTSFLRVALAGIIMAMQASSDMAPIARRMAFA